MELEVHNVGSSLIINVDGHITGMMEVGEIKNVMDSNQEISLIELDLNDAIVVPSALIGLLLKKSQEENKKVVLKTHHKEIQELFHELNLQNQIEVKVEHE